MSEPTRWEIPVPRGSHLLILEPETPLQPHEVEMVEDSARRIMTHFQEHPDEPLVVIGQPGIKVTWAENPTDERVREIVRQEFAALERTLRLNAITGIH